MNCRLWVGVAAMLISGRASADGDEKHVPDDFNAKLRAAITVEVSVGAGEVFDTSNAPTPMILVDSTAIHHDHYLGPTISVGLGGFISDSVALLARGTCTGPISMCFLGPTAQYWFPGHHYWISAGGGLGADVSCIGRVTSYGTDQHYCRAGSDAFDARVGMLLDGESRGTAGVSLTLEFIQVGTFTSDGTGDALSFQLGYQWH